MRCSRCGAHDVRLVPAHWADKHYCPYGCLELDGRTPPAVPTCPTIPIARVVSILDATIVTPPTGADPYGLSDDNHVWTRCDTCGEGSMVRRGKTPRCRMTPHCEGQHIAPVASPRRPSLSRRVSKPREAPNGATR
jgi:hypothetical protein